MSAVSRIAAINFVLLASGCASPEQLECRNEASKAPAVFAKLVRKQTADSAKIFEKHGRRAPNLNGHEGAARLREEIAIDTWGLRFALEEILPTAHFPRALYGWDSRLAEKDMALMPDASPDALRKRAFLESMFELSPGSHQAASNYARDVIRLWVMTTKDEWGFTDQSLPPPSLQALVKQWRATRVSFGPFRQALIDTVEHPDFDKTLKIRAENICVGDP